MVLFLLAGGLLWLTGDSKTYVNIAARFFQIEHRLNWSPRGGIILLPNCEKKTEILIKCVPTCNKSISRYL